jgi:hypothetical protein
MSSTRATPTQTKLTAEPIEGTNLKVLRNIRGPKGSKFTAVFHGSFATLTNEAEPDQFVIVTSDDAVVAEESIKGVLDTIGEGIVEVLDQLKKLLSCTPKQTTHVTVKNGKVTDITVTNECVPN